MEKKEKSFEESLLELEQIVKDLENGEVALDDAIDKYTTAMMLSKVCSEKLENAEEEDGSMEEFKNIEE